MAGKADHPSKPVIVDADGRKHPIVSYNPSNTETCVVETETVVKQQVLSPFVNDYKHSSYSNVEPLKDYGHVKDQGHTTSSPVHGQGLRHKVDAFLNKVQTEASRPKRFGLLSPSLWHRNTNSTAHQGHESGHGNTGYGDYKSSGHTIQNGDYDNYKHNNLDRMEPAMITAGGWARPNRAAWATPPDTVLSRPKNDIGTAGEYLKDAAGPTSVISSPYSRMNVPITSGPKRDHDYGQTVDSREATRRYGDLNSSSVPKEIYPGTIDSREAARKYKGTME